MACLECRKGFRVANRFRIAVDRRDEPGAPRRAACPQCGQPMVDMGPDFRAPRQSDRKQWERVRTLLQKGFNFYSCDCCGPGYDEDELRAVHDYVRGKIPRTEGEHLIVKIIERNRSKS